MILICYDGSKDSRAAIERAAELFRSQPATILTVWQPFLEVAARSTVGFGLVPSIPDADEIDEASQKASEQTAGEGVKLAQALGLKAGPRVTAQVSTTGRAILKEADDVGASVIVMGTRGLTGVKSLLLGSVSHEVVEHADRTVAIVPSPEVAASRGREMHHEVSK